MKKKNFTPFLLTTALCLTMANALLAQTYVNHAASGNNDGSSWENAYTDLGAALANTTSGAIWVAGGTYKPGGPTADTLSTFYCENALELYGGFAGNESALEERDIVDNPTILSGDVLGDDDPTDLTLNRADNVRHVVFVDSLAASGMTIIDGFTIKNGNTSAFDLGETAVSGGGVFSFAPITLRNCLFTENVGTSGGSVYLTNFSDGGADNSVVEDCIFDNNLSSNQSAGLLAVALLDLRLENCIFRNNTTNRGSLYTLFCNGVNLTNCQFIDNEHIDNDVGFCSAYFSWSSINVALNFCIFQGNNAGFAAGIYHDGRNLTADAENMVLTSCVFDANTAAERGGAIFSSDAGMTIDSCTFSGNTGSSAGGQVYHGGGGTQDILIKNTLFEEGESAYGGAHIFFGSNLASFRGENNRYVNNEADVSAGAFLISSFGEATLVDCTFEDNRAAFGGAILMQDDGTTVSIEGSEFLDNEALQSGGAIYLLDGIDCDLMDTRFEENNAVFGGAISADNGVGSILAELEITNTIFYKNQASQQAAGLNINDFNTSIFNTLFAKNNATNSDPMSPTVGGAMANNSPDSTEMVVSVTNSTFVDNFAEIGAGIAQWEGGPEAECVLRVQNSIFFDLDASYEVEDGEPEVVSLGGNLVNDSSFEEYLMHPKDQNNVIAVVFADQDGEDYRLFDGSPALDAGVEENTLSFDLEGNGRIREVDAGAYECQCNPVSIKNPVENTGVFKLFPNPVLAEAVLELDNEWSGDISVELFNFLGQSMKSWDYSKTTGVFQTNLDLSDLSPGTYSVAVSNPASTMVYVFTKF